MVTAEQVKQAALAADIKRIDLCRCSICQEMFFYFIAQERIYFNSGGSGDSTPRLCAWEDVAELINRQRSESVRDSLKALFGLQPKGNPAKHAHDCGCHKQPGMTCSLEETLATMQHAIDLFCKESDWCAATWKRQPHISKLFSLRSKN